MNKKGVVAFALLGFSYWIGRRIFDINRSTVSLICAETVNHVEFAFSHLLEDNILPLSRVFQPIQKSMAGQ